MATGHLVRITKAAVLNFYLLPKNTSYTPLPVEELELIQAGLGRQTVSLPEDGNHSDVQLSVQLFNVSFKVE